MTIQFKFHSHDCEDCKHLGSVVLPKEEGRMYDVYHCPVDGSMIARFGEEGDYLAWGEEMFEHFKHMEEGTIRKVAMTLLE